MSRFCSSRPRVAQICLLILGLSLFACQLPATLMNKSQEPEGTPLSIPSSPSPYPWEEIPLAVPTLPAGAASPILTETPAQAAYPEIPPAASYPEPTLSAEYPGAIQATASLGIPYPEIAAGSSRTPSPLAASPTLTAALTSGYPEPAGQLEATAYPGAEIYPTYPNPYPEGGGPTLPAPYDPYPGQGTAPAPPTPTASPFQLPSSTPKLPQMQATSSPPQQGPAGPALEPGFSIPTSPPIPSRTPFLTPTPTQTPTPTPTRTPLPAPPWVSSKLKATDPSMVKLAAGKPQLVMFFAFWSGPSLAMAPIIQRIEEEYRGRVNFIYLDIDDPDGGAFKRQLNFRAEPHFFLLDGQGKPLRQWVGYITAASLRLALNDALE